MTYVENTDLEKGLEKLIDLSQDFSLKSNFQSVGSYSDFWTSILGEKGFQSLATLALTTLVMMPTTYMAEKGFSVLVDIKTKKRNRLKSVDDLMRGALEKLIQPRKEKIAETIQAQCSH